MSIIIANLIKGLPEKIDEMVIKEFSELLKDKGFEVITDEVNKVNQTCSSKKMIYFGKG